MGESGERELLLVVRGGLRDLAAGLLNPSVGHAGADGCSGQD